MDFQIKKYVASDFTFIDTYSSFNKPLPFALLIYSKDKAVIFQAVDIIPKDQCHTT